PVSNLAALAQGALRKHGVQQVAAAIDARMDEVYWGCYKAEAGEMRLQGLEAVLPPERVAVPAGSSGDWFGAGTGWSYAERLAVQASATNASALPGALDILSLASFAWGRGEAIAAEQAQPVYLRDNVATPKAR
ncbi:tRNA (adenosine(37)-N6)-threonylcarbamoyltransferase complex dimerization subunit type 1 TsaB, partial [Pseudomonas sp.]|uniref:tRNA (adenosine(37)-N6)-threonylcarbamoyltransferase complex dimerization subunit type 1 TsaB n=1 Tax=Pseudomonas sp. TaxID=306 RepID=UPI0028A86A5E